MIYLFFFFCFHLKIIIIKKLKKKFLVVFYNFLIIIIVILDTFIYKNNCFEQFYEVNLIYTVATSTVVTCRFAQFGVYTTPPRLHRKSSRSKNYSLLYRCFDYERVTFLCHENVQFYRLIDCYYNQILFFEIFYCAKIICE